MRALSTQAHDHQPPGLKVTDYVPAHPLEGEEFDRRWTEYFNTPDLDDWELGKGLNDVFQHDLCPDVPLIICMLRACRRLNDAATPVRIIEAIQDKVPSHEAYQYIMNGIKPVLEELGISTPEELGFA